MGLGVPQLPQKAKVVGIPQFGQYQVFMIGRGLPHLEQKFKRFDVPHAHVQLPATLVI